MSNFCHFVRIVCNFYWFTPFLLVLNLTHKYATRTSFWHWGHGRIFFGRFFEKRAFCLLACHKQISFSNISNEIGLAYFWWGVIFENQTHCKLLCIVDYVLYVLHVACGVLCVCLCTRMCVCACMRLPAKIINHMCATFTELDTLLPKPDSKVLLLLWYKGWAYLSP